MKRKVTRIRGVADIESRLKGVAVFRVTGPCVKTGERVTVQITGTREDAANLELRSEDATHVSSK